MKKLKKILLINWLYFSKEIIEVGDINFLTGKNGAGKSTLMNVLTGVFPRDKGEIEFDGTELKNITIRQSENMGIAFVHQELNLFNDLKVYENIFLQKEYTTKLGRLDKKKMIQEAERLFHELGVDIDPTQQVSKLKTSQKQLLEISKALIKALISISNIPKNQFCVDVISEHAISGARNIFSNTALMMHIGISLLIPIIIFYFFLSS